VVPAKPPSPLIRGPGKTLKTIILSLSSGSLNITRTRAYTHLHMYDLKEKRKRKVKRFCRDHVIFVKFCRDHVHDSRNEQLFVCFVEYGCENETSLRSGS
jgi:hypothetical protein